MDWPITTRRCNRASRQRHPSRCPLTRAPASSPIAACPTPSSPIPARNAAEYTVSEISGALKRAVEDQFGNVRVRGEISGYRGPHSSGHAYFALKDDRARHRGRGLAHDHGEAALPARRGHGGDRQRQAHHLSRLVEIPDRHRQSGAGRRRRADGAARGAQAQARRRRPVRSRRASGRLPYMPRVIGVVTSPTGAVIRDIIHRIKDRFPVHVLVWPVRVQGETCGAEVTAAVHGFNALPQAAPIPRPDVLIVARGGGSLEDLWGFNDEALARAVAASGHPGDLGGRPRDRLDADRFRRRHARADADRAPPKWRCRSRPSWRPPSPACTRGCGPARRAASTASARRCAPPRGRCPRPTSCWRCRAAASTRRPAGSAGR